ncbi:hypothetical protein ACWOF5_13705 [Carnobacterium divergens]
MNVYKCEECGEKFKKEQLDPELFNEGEICCKNCTEFLLESGRDFVDPDHNYDSFEDWEENGG